MGRPLSPAKAGEIIGHWRNRRTYSEIARQMQVHRNTVYGVIKRYREQGTLVPRRSTGRRRITTARDDRALFRIMRDNRRFCAQRLRAEWQNQTNIRVSRQTVNRRLLSRGYMARRLVKAPRLSNAAKRRRLQWAREHLNRHAQHWRHAVFCDESRFLLHRVDGRYRVRRSRGEDLGDDSYQGAIAHGGGSVHIWGAICYQGKSEIRVLDQNVTGHLYLDILQNNLVPDARQHYGNNWILVDDNARPHRANVVQEYLDEQQITRLDWPPYSPDMNVIEHMWDEIGRRLEELYPRPQNLHQLGQVIRNLWQQVPMERVRTLIDSMPRRVRALADARGGNTRY